MMRLLTRFVLSVALVLATAVTTEAQNDDSALGRIVTSGELRVGMTGSQPPFTVISKDGDLIGYEVELAQLLTDAIGVELKLVQMSFVELLPALEAGDIDAIMSGMTMTPERNIKVAFVGPYVVSGKSILTKSSTLAAVREAGEMDQASVSLAALEGSTSQTYVEEFMPNANLVTTKDYDTAVQMVLDGSVDALVADYPICALTVLRHPNAGLTLAEPITIEPIGMALPPGDAQLLNLVRNYLSTLQLTGVLKRLQVKWFEDNAWLVLLP